jgi:LytR cell envelope-related transcriptional attenuator
MARGARPTGRGGPGAPRHWSPLRALVLVAVFVALGAYLIDLGAGRHPPASAASSSSTTTTTTAPTTPSTTTTTAPSGVQPSKTVNVLVANASQTNGIAAYYSGKLAAAGWGTLTPVTATTATATSSVYYATGQQQSAQAVAVSLGVPTSAVQPLGSTVPVASTTGADVVVVAGNDLAAKVPASST